MTITALHKQLTERHAIYTRQLGEKRAGILQAEQALIRARCEADTISGAIQATQSAIYDLERVMQQAKEATTPATPAPLQPAPNPEKAG